MRKRCQSITALGQSLRLFAASAASSRLGMNVVPRGPASDAAKEWNTLPA
jgi:hypothetical protein